MRLVLTLMGLIGLLLEEADAGEVHISGRMRIVDDDDLSQDEVGEFTFSRNLELNENQLHGVFRETNSVDDEVRVELVVDVRLLDDGSVQLNVNAKLFEGSSSSTDDLDGEVSEKANLSKSKTYKNDFRVRNVDEGGDYADIVLIVKNR